MLKSDIVRSPGIDTTAYGAELYHSQEVGVSLNNPYAPNWGHYYNGSGSRSYTAISNSLQLVLGSGNWTVECFVRFFENTIDNTYTRRIIGVGNDVVTGWSIEIADISYVVGGQTVPAGGLIFRNNGQILGTTVAVNDGRWHHIAWSKTGSTLYCYIDGVLQGSAIFAYNLSQTGDIVVGRHASQGAGAFEGWISNCRITAGTSLYSGAPTITVPTSRLTTATGNVIALFNHRAAFNVDESQYQQRVYRSGDPITQLSIGPFPDSPDIQQAISLVYPYSRLGYSITLPDGRYRIGSNDFNIEFWFKPHGSINNTSVQQRLFSIGNFQVASYKGSQWDGVAWTDAFGAVTNSGPVTAGGGDSGTGYSYHHWNHVVFARVAGWCTVYINGVLRGTTYNNNTINGGQMLTVGNVNGLGVSGQYNDQTDNAIIGQAGAFSIADLRIVVGHGLISSSTNYSSYTTSTTYIPVPSSPVYNNSGWRGLQTATNIIFSGFAAQHNKNNRMPMNTGYGYHPIIAQTFTNAIQETWMSGRYDQNDYGAMGTFTPFGTHGWSAYFTGTTSTFAFQDAISLPTGKLGGVNTSTGVALDLLRSYASAANTGLTNQTTGHDFTVECWFMCATVMTNNLVFNLNTQSTISQLLVYTTGTQIGMAMAATNTAWAINTASLGSTGTILPNVWYHLAVVKSSSTVRLYINGNDLTAPYYNPATGTTGGLAFFNTWSGVISYTGNYIGYSGILNGPFPGVITSMTGFISNVRILQGLALYTGPFVPAVNRPLGLTQNQAYNQQRLYYPTDGTGGSLGLYTTTKGQGQTFSSGTSLLAVPTALSTWNTSTWNTTTNTSTFWQNIVVSTTATSDWTVEFWVYPESIDTSATNSQNVPLVSLFGTGTNRCILSLGLIATTNNVSLVPKIDMFNDTSSPTGWINRLNVSNFNSGWFPPITTQNQVVPYRWTHIAATRQSGSWYVYVNGYQAMAISTGSTFNQAFQSVQQIGIGPAGNNTGGGGGITGAFANSFDSVFQGMISNVRIIQGQAIYTGTFTATNVTFNTSTVGMSGPNIAATLTGLVVFLGAQDMTGAQGYVAGDGSYRRHMAVINSGTLVNGTTTTQHYAITERADNAAIFPRWMGPVGCMPSLYTLASKTFEDLSYNTQTVSKVQYSGVKLVPFAPYKTPTAHNPTVNGGSYYFNGKNVLFSPGSWTGMYGNRDFTIETWIYLDTPLNNSKINYLWDLGATSGGAQSPRIRIDATGQISLRNQSDTALLTSPLPNIIHSGAWYHIAWTRRRGVGQGWLNGKSFGTYTDTTVYNDYRSYDSGFSLGNEQGKGANNGFVGYVASTRIVNDYAMYTAEFTPPTRAHVATTNTFFLLNFNSYQIYDPSQKSNISVIGDIRTLYDESPYANAWSWSFDGKQTGNWIATNNVDMVPVQASGGSLIYGNGDFTFEGWFNILELQGRGGNTADTYHTIIDWQGQDDANVFNGATTATDAQYFGVFIANSGTVIVANGVKQNTATPNPVIWGPLNTATTMCVTVSSWTHIAVVRQSSLLKVFINGYNVGETINTTQWSGTGTDLLLPAANRDYTPRPVFGTKGYNPNGVSYWYDGYMSNVRMVKGLAVYTTSSAGSTVQQFVPPTSPFTTATTSATNVQAVPGLGVYGSSQYFTSATVATTNFVNTPIGSGLDVVNNAFTIEGWACYQYSTNSNQTLFSLGTNAQNRVSLYTTGSGYTLNFNAIVGGSHTINLTGPVIVSTNTNGLVITLPNPAFQIIQGQPQTVYGYTTSSSSNRWFHWAVSKDAAGAAGTVRLFVNGQVYASGTSPSWFADGSNYMAFGFDPFVGTTATGHNLVGFLSNVRVTKNHCLYVNTFTPPTTGYIGSIVGSTGAGVPTFITGTVTVLALNTTTLRDLSSNAYSLSSTGNTFVDNSFGPFGWAPGLLAFNGRNLVNSGPNTGTILVNNIAYGAPKATLNTPYTAYNTPLQLGNRSLFFTAGSQNNLGINGTSGNDQRISFIKVQDQPHHQFGEGQFTVELWFMQPYEYRSSGGTRRTLISKGGSPTADGGGGNVTRGWWLGLETGTGPGRIAFCWDNNIIRTTTIPAYNTWHHVVVQRETTASNGLKIFLDGALEAAGTMPQTVNTYTWYQSGTAGSFAYTPSALLIGMSASSNYDLSHQFVGYMDDIRMTFGVARYANTSSITVPTTYNNER
jgi:hypothetical protein